MGRPRKNDKTKKTAQVEEAGQDPGVGDQERNVVDGNAENVTNTEAGGSGLGGNRKSQSDTESSTDSLMENARRRLQRSKRARIVSPDNDNEEEEDSERSVLPSKEQKGKGKGKGKSSPSQ